MSDEYWVMSRQHNLTAHARRSLLLLITHNSVLITVHKGDLDWQETT